MGRFISHKFGACLSSVMLWRRCWFHLIIATLIFMEWGKIYEEGVTGTGSMIFEEFEKNIEKLNLEILMDVRSWFTQVDLGVIRIWKYIIWCFSDRASQYRLFSSYQLNAHFLYSITIYMLHYNPQHVSSSTLLIFRRTNCIITASGIVTVCKQPYSMPVESRLQSALNRHPVRLFTESNDTRGCNNTICPPEDEQGTARNMLRVVM